MFQGVDRLQREWVPSFLMNDTFLPSTSSLGQKGKTVAEDGLWYDPVPWVLNEKMTMISYWNIVLKQHMHLVAIKLPF